jgi:hypothetical protein
MLMLINANTLMDVQLSGGVTFDVSVEDKQLVHVQLVNGGQKPVVFNIIDFMLPPLNDDRYVPVGKLVIDVAQALCKHLAVSTYNLLATGKRALVLNDLVKEFMTNVAPTDLDVINRAHAVAHAHDAEQLPNELGFNKVETEETT